MADNEVDTVRLVVHIKHATGGEVNVVEVDALIHEDGQVDAGWLAQYLGIKKKTLTLRGVEPKEGVTAHGKDMFLMKFERGGVVELDAEEKPVVHSHIGCDSCGTAGFSGVRYHCNKCGDADFCAECVENGSEAILHTSHAETARRIFGPEYEYEPSEHVLVAKTTRSKYLPSCIRQSLWETFQLLFLNGGEMDFIGTFESDLTDPARPLKITWKTYLETYDDVVRFAAGLRGLVPAGSVVATFAPPSAECIVIDFACVMHKMIFVPIHTNLVAETLQKVIVNSGLKAVCATSDHAKRLSEIEDGSLLQSITLIHIGPGLETLSPDVTSRFKLVIQYEDVLKAGEDAWYPPLLFADGDTTSLCYTSGSSGEAKGAIMTHKIIKTDIWRWMHSLQPTPFINLLYLPLSHMMGRSQITDTLARNGQIAILYKNDMKYLHECVRLLEPTKFVGVPSVFASMMAEYNAEREIIMKAHGGGGGSAGSRIKKQPGNRRGSCGIIRTDDQEYRAAIERAKNPCTVDKDTEELLDALDKKYSLMLGRRLRKTGVGAAKVPPEMIPWLSKMFFVTQEGYGTTETGSIATNGLIQVPYKLVDVPELQYFQTDKPYPRGELLVKTACMVPGYYNSPELNERFFDDDGYFRTGDVVQIRGQYVDIIDRKGNIVKLSEGEFVAPESLAGSLAKSPYVSQVYVYVNAAPSGIACVVYPTELGKAMTAEEHLAEFRRIVEGDGRPAHEMPGVVIISPEPFTTENGMLTTTKKICRHGIHQRFAAEIAAIFEKKANGLTALIETAMNGQSSSKDVKKAVLALLKAEGRDIPDDTEVDLRSLGLDSLTYARVMGKLKTTFNTRELREFERDFSEEPTETVPPGDLVARDLERLQNDIKRERPTARDGLTAPPGSVLLTGSTGIVGKSVLENLVRDAASTRIYCLIRHASTRASMLTPSELFSSPKVVVLEGDITKADFGLLPDVYLALCREISTVIHCAAKVSWVAGYPELRKENVLGTAEVLKFAKKCSGPIQFTYVSTVSVTGVGTVEHAQYEAMNGRGYSSSKEAGEVLVKTAGLPSWSIVRLCFVAPSEDDPTCFCNKTDAVYLLAQSLHQAGLRLETTGGMAVAPSNVIASQILVAPHITTTILHPTAKVSYAKLNPEGAAVTPTEFTTKYCTPEMPVYPLAGFLPWLLKTAPDDVSDTAPEVAHLYNALF
eukprot:TRINITY_DN1859_c0_g1_i1.p1 TRINITY_DN1859_c0_g1~~TRINITY_DN1859_c0_g1_i1.p1  ORF type:complete len:1199 (+),score=145.07 TRINITY_DN1859_c0_g1_i1:41-3637(+)